LKVRLKYGFIKEILLMRIHLLTWIPILLILLPSANAACMIYFTGIGCPHCAKTDPIIFKQLVNEYNLTIIEYEIYQTKGNGRVMYEYASAYGQNWYGIPLVIFSENKYIIGDIPILNNIDQILKESGNNQCLLLNKKVYPKELDLNQLPGTPKVWVRDRVLVKGNTYLSPEIIKSLLFSEDPVETLETFNDTIYATPCMPYSGGEVCFQHGVKFNNDWIFVWNGRELNKTLSASETSKPVGIKEKEIDHELTLSKIVSLAAVDAINPCALAVLTLMLIAIMSYNPKKKYKVLLAGLAFSSSVYIMYLIYGLVIVKFFQIVSQLVITKIYIYKALAIFAIILGIFNLKDAVRYKPGGLLREMPMKWRPKVKKIISGITSPMGAIFVGFFVTVFLLPCTMGPYVIAGGILSPLEFLKTLPWLLLYNLIFISPMLMITFAIYIGYTTVDKVSGWREKNIRYLHAIAGIIMLSLGVLMVFGIV